MCDDFFITKPIILPELKRFTETSNANILYTFITPDGKAKGIIWNHQLFVSLQCYECRTWFGLDDFHCQKCHYSFSATEKHCCNCEGSRPYLGTASH